MFAIIESGGKQYRVSIGEKIKTEIIPSKKEGDIILFDKILLFNNDKEVQIGTPYLDNILVKGEILKKIKGEKLIAFKYKPKKRYRRKIGHRQQYFEILIKDISPKASSVSSEKIEGAKDILKTRSKTKKTSQKSAT